MNVVPWVCVSTEVLNTWAGSKNYKVHHGEEKFEEFNKGTQLTKIYSWVMIKKPFRMHQIIIPMQRNIHEYVLNKHTWIFEKQNTKFLFLIWYKLKLYWICSKMFQDPSNYILLKVDNWDNLKIYFRPVFLVSFRKEKKWLIS